MKIETILESWEAMNEFLSTATETQAAQLLEAEKKGRARLQHLMRLYGRFNKLRTTRERVELAKSAKGGGK